MNINKFKYPIEIELTDFCTLKCLNCVNPFLKNKWFMSQSDFIQILSYIYKNKDSILYINLSWIWDIFSHPKFIIFFELIIEKFSGTNINILIPTKLQQFKPEHITVLLKAKKSGININISIWIYSVIKKKHDELCGFDNYDNIFKKIKLLRQNNIDFSFELLDNNLSNLEKQYFDKLLFSLGVDWSIHNYHNFWGEIWLTNKNVWLESCTFNSEDYKLELSHCSFIPIISQNWDIYTCSISWKNKNFLIWNYKFLFNKYPKYADLVNYINKDFLNKEICKNCSIYQPNND